MSRVHETVESDPEFKRRRRTNKKQRLSCLPLTWHPKQGPFREALVGAMLGGSASMFNVKEKSGATFESTPGPPWFGEV